MTIPVRLTVAAGAAAATLLLSGCAAATLAAAGPTSPSTAAPAPAAPAPVPVSDALASNPAPTGPSADLDALLTTLTVVESLPDVPGYDRSCSPGDGCVFGPAWTDDSDAPLARNGCDTRNDVLGLSLDDPVFKPGTRDCKVLSGTLLDPYTGTAIAFTAGRATSSAVQIDHVFPLSRAWDAGAAGWDLQRRTTFANDVELNLRATDGRTNSAKSDSGPETWLPPNSADHCRYTTAYLTVAASYDLLVTTGDVDATRTACAEATP